ncbi:hypothetical protein [Mycoplasmopsis felifaucium]|uniref:hypothetical protein n=1 Tax=Mycoplasmopsis felifaucium TaxID=35768 RepID=UPI000483CB04|nr:hypothetical protein [Mycoplasmopsis felifaucium]
MFPVVSASCVNITNDTRDKKPDKTNNEKIKKLNRVWFDYNLNQKYNYNTSKYQFDKSINKKYEALSKYLIDILRESRFGAINNLSDENINKIQALFRLKSDEKLELETNNNLSLNEKIERLKQNYYVYSPLQDYLDNKIKNDKNQEAFKAVDDIYVYDFGQKQKNKELNYSFNQNNINKLMFEKYYYGLGDAKNALKPKEAFDKVNQEYEEFLKKYKEKEVLTNDDFNEYWQKSIDNHWLQLNYRSEFYNGFERMWNTYLTDNIWLLAKNNYRYYGEHPDTFNEDEITINEEYNPVFKNAKLMVSNNINSKMPILQRNMKLFSGRGQGTDLFSNDQKMYILTAKHVIKFMTRENKFVDQNFIPWYKYDPENKISTDQRKELSPVYWETGIVLDFSKNYSFEVLDKNLNVIKIDLPYQALKVVSEII